MMLTNKTILLLSPQEWQTMFISKHHYAVELAKKGNTVYFLCPLVKWKRNDIHIARTQQENLFLVNHRLIFPDLKFHAQPLFRWTMKRHLNRIIKKINRKIDIVWSFDLGNYFPFDLFSNSIYKIFHPVDEPLNKDAIDAGNGADIIFSVTKEILEKYQRYKTASYFINHGVAEEFLYPAQPDKKQDNNIHIGFAGNLTREDIDRDILLQIIKDNPEVVFDCWGLYDVAVNRNVRDELTMAFIDSLKQCRNVLLHGAVSPHELSRQIRSVDAFLICYDVNKDQSKGTNYHKVMEFLSTGKVIISNNITTYKDEPPLVTMVTDRDHNRALPLLCKEVLDNLAYYNAASLQEQRISFATSNTYPKQIERIEDIISREGQLAY